MASSSVRFVASTRHGRTTLAPPMQALHSSQPKRSPLLRGNTSHARAYVRSRSTSGRHPMVFPADALPSNELQQPALEKKHGPHGHVLNVEWTIDFTRPEGRLSMVVLNGEQEHSEEMYDVMDALWGACDRIVFVDGGSNGAHDYLKRKGKADKQRPSCVIGDLDSIFPHVREFYEQDKSTAVLQIADQDSNDMEKALKWLESEDRTGMEDALPFYPSNPSQLMTHSLHPSWVLVLGAFGGRIDQEMQNINVCMNFSTVERMSCVIPISHDNIGCILQPGTNIVKPDFGIHRRTCGIIPFQKSILTTKGLKWDVANWTTEFGGQMSSSNEICDTSVYIETTNKVLWCSPINDNVEWDKVRLKWANPSRGSPTSKM